MRRSAGQPEQAGGKRLWQRHNARAAQHKKLHCSAPLAPPLQRPPAKMAIFRRAAAPALATCVRQASTAAPSLLRLNEVVDGVRFRTPTLGDARTMVRPLPTRAAHDIHVAFSTFEARW